MRQRKKIRQKKNDFYLGVALYSVLSIVALVFLAFIFSNNLEVSGQANRQTIVSAAALHPEVDSFSRVMDEVDAYTRNHIGDLALANNVGGTASTVDSVDFINYNRALVFYHENKDRYLSEEVFHDQGGRINVERFILKIKNDVDYSHGVYGAD